MARRILAALLFVLAVAPSGAVAGADTFGASYSPHPLIVEHWAPARIRLVNTGTVPIDIALTVTGDGYALERDRVALAPATDVDVALSAIGAGDATITATVTNAEPGTDRPALVLTGKVTHVNPLERIVRDLWPALLLVLFAAILLGLVIRQLVRQRRQSGQALVEFALVAPILMAMLLGVLAGGLLFLGAMSQQHSTGTLADWMAANPDATSEEEAAMSALVIPDGCDSSVDTAGQIVTATLTCPTIAGELVPGLPVQVTTSAVAHAPSPSPIAEEVTP